MIHDQETIHRIKELLESSQITDEDILDEMTDHYLSEIERKVAERMNHQSAIRATFQHIANTDFSQMAATKKTKRYLLLILGLVTFLVGYTWQQYSDQPTSIIKESTDSVWPDGWPLKDSEGTIAAHFGERSHPFKDHVRHHKGIDIKAQLGAPVIATGHAVVKEVGYTESYGHYIILKHSDRYFTRYCHLSAVTVDKDEQVTKGMTIGAVGSSGMSISPHLHYEILDGVVQIDPIECIRA